MGNAVHVGQRVNHTPSKQTDNKELSIVTIEDTKVEAATEEQRAQPMAMRATGRKAAAKKAAPKKAAAKKAAPKKAAPKKAAAKISRGSDRPAPTRRPESAPESNC